MKFINRTKELEFINETERLAKKKLFSLVIYGLRRVGKTRLILEILSASDLYFFVNKDKTSESLLKEYEKSLKTKGILNKLEYLKSWDQFFEIIFERYKGIIAFDEFQNFLKVDPSIFGILQKQMDLNENKKDLLLIFSGSTIGLIKKLFENKKEPLYGRVKRKLFLKPLSFKEIIKMCAELKINNFEEAINLYCILGGFPKYYVSIEDEDLIEADFNKILDKFFFTENAVLEEEVSTILSLEFGKRKGLYFDILTAVANGNTKISEISAFLSKKETLFTRHLNEITRYFEIIYPEKQVVGKKSLLFIGHPLINFWFRFFYRDLSLYKIRDKNLIETIKSELLDYIGKRFESVCIGFLQELNKQKKLPFKYDIIGKQWGKFKGEKGKNTYEIDILEVNEKEKKILFAECKWKNNVNANKILYNLKEKSKFVEWNNRDRKEYYAIFAKSFKNKNVDRVLLFDLKDMEKIFK